MWPAQTDLSIDQKLLHTTYEKWPEHFKQAEKLSATIDRDPNFYRSIFLCGMGGSATSCDILNDLMQFNGTHFSAVVRGNSLPRMANNRSLIILNSVSGNTEEILSLAEEASTRRAEVICISSGGRLKDLASSYGYMHIHIPNLSLPRASLPYLVIPGLKLIMPFLKDFDGHDISSIATDLSEIAQRIRISVPEEENIAKKIASFLKNGFVFCFSSTSLACVGRRFKNSLNENAKLHCVEETILESTHNEIVPFTFKSNAFTRKVVLLRWRNDVPLIEQRFKKVQGFFSEIGQPYMELVSSESSLVAARLSSIYILDYSTVYMAIARGIDPSPTPAIDILKRI